MIDFIEQVGICLSEGMWNTTTSSTIKGLLTHIAEISSYLELTREELKAAILERDHYKHLAEKRGIAEAELSAWRRNTITALESHDFSSPISLWVTDSGIEVRPPVDFTGGESVSIEATFTEASDEN